MIVYSFGNWNFILNFCCNYIYVEQYKLCSNHLYLVDWIKIDFIL